MLEKNVTEKDLMGAFEDDEDEEIGDDERLFA